MGRDGFDPARAQVFQPLERFGSPSAADIRIGEWVKAFYQAVCQKCARVARQGERGRGDLFDGKADGLEREAGTRLLPFTCLLPASHAHARRTKARLSC